MASKTVEGSFGQFGSDKTKAFVVNFGDNHDRPRSSPPKRFLKYQKKTVSKEELDKKQKDAERRRKVCIHNSLFIVLNFVL